MKRVVLGILASIFASSFAVAAVSTDLSQTMDREEQELVKDYTEALDAEVEVYAELRAQEEYASGQEGCQLGYGLIAREQYVHYSSLNNHSFYATLYFRCTDDDAFVSTEREPILLVCQKDIRICNVSRQN